MPGSFSTSSTTATPNLEYFHDHVRIERLLFEGTQVPVDGLLHRDRSRPGLGLAFKPQDARPFAV